MERGIEPLGAVVGTILVNILNAEQSFHLHLRTCFQSLYRSLSMDIAKSSCQERCEIF